MTEQALQTGQEIVRRSAGYAACASALPGALFHHRFTAEYATRAFPALALREAAHVEGLSAVTDDATTAARSPALENGPHAPARPAKPSTTAAPMHRGRGRTRTAGKQTVEGLV